MREPRRHADGDEDLVELRVLVPRSELPAARPAGAEFVSQESSLDLFGLPPRRFLEIVRSPRFTYRVLRIGKLRLVRRDELLAHLEAIDETDAGADSEAEGNESSVANLASRLGLEEVPLAARRARGGPRG